MLTYFQEIEVNLSEAIVLDINKIGQFQPVINSSPCLGLISQCIMGHLMYLDWLLIDEYLEFILWWRWKYVKHIDDTYVYIGRLCLFMHQGQMAIVLYTAYSMASLKWSGIMLWSENNTGI